MDFSKDLDVKKVLIKLIHYSTGFKSLCEVFLPEEMSFLTKLRLLGIVAMSIDCEVAIGNESEDDSEYIIVDESGNFYKDNSSYFDNDSEEILFFTKEFRTGPFSIDQV